jgi:L-fucose mutarotase
MLKGIDPLLSGDLLHILDDMGHGDVLMLVDRNYPAVASGRPVIRLGEVTVLRAAQAILSVFPLDSFIERPLERMEVDNDPTKTTPTQDSMLKLASESEGRSLRSEEHTRLNSSH